MVWKTVVPKVQFSPVVKPPGAAGNTKSSPSVGRASQFAASLQFTLELPSHVLVAAANGAYTKHVADDQGLEHSSVEDALALAPALA